MAEIVEDINYCAVHAEREASLQCIRCNRFMCTQCAKHTPVGYVCQQCYRQQDNTFFRGTNTDNIVIFAVVGVLTGIGGYIVSATSIPFFFFLLFGLPIGATIGQAALRATQRRKTRNAHWVGAGAAIIGGFIGGIIQILVEYNGWVSDIASGMGVSMEQAQAQLGGPNFDYVMNYLRTDWGLLVFVAIVAFGVYGRYKMRL